MSFQNICCAASVECNGMLLGELWKRPWIIEIPLEYLKTGANLLKVTVSGILFNAIYHNAESELEETTLEGWPYFSEIMNRSRRELLFAIPEREKNLGLQPMGISGDVYLLENPENPSCIVFEK